MKYWSGFSPIDQQQAYLPKVYGVLVAATCVLGLCKSVLFFAATLAASTSVHMEMHAAVSVAHRPSAACIRTRHHKCDHGSNYSTCTVGKCVCKLVRSTRTYCCACCDACCTLQVTRAPMSFHNSNPHGRILNRFSNDQGNVDELLPVTAYNAIEVCVLAVCTHVCSNLHMQLHACLFVS